MKNKIVAPIGQVERTFDNTPKYLTSPAEPTEADMIEFHDWLMGLSDQRFRQLEAVLEGV